MDNNDNKAQNAAQQTQQPSGNATPAGTGEPAATEKTFTQDEVNQIISDRLKRERAKQNEPSEKPEGSAKFEEKERDLSARENALQCRELIAINKEYPKEFLDVLDTSDFKKFKENADKLLKAFPSISPSAPRFVFSSAMNHGSPISGRESLSEAFGLNK